MENNEDVVDDITLKKVEIDSSFPKYMIKNLDKFKKFII